MYIAVRTRMMKHLLKANLKLKLSQRNLLQLLPRQRQSLLQRKQQLSLVSLRRSRHLMMIMIMMMQLIVIQLAHLSLRRREVLLQLLLMAAAQRKLRVREVDLKNSKTALKLRGLIKL
jgi:hypothetical protein